MVLATGTSPAIPPIDGLADSQPWTNRDAVKLRSLPSSLAVLGGGAIGLELAQAFSRFGVKVTVMEALDRILAPEEPETSELLTKVLREEGIVIHTGVAAKSVARDGGVTITLADGSIVEADEILVAAGRTPNVRGIGLESIGLDETARPTFTVDEHMRVNSTERLWAVGDITGTRRVHAHGHLRSWCRGRRHPRRIVTSHRRGPCRLASDVHRSRSRLGRD